MVQIGDPFVGSIPRQMSKEELLQALRVDLAGELEAIIVYEAHALATNDERVKKVLYHIAEEEKHHVGELQQLIYMLSPNDQKAIQQGHQEVMDQQAQNFQPPMQ
ncbi:MAG: rubrerythrin family protein [Syntrophomonadaceae bacterium]|nr:rubrerythrin family protein [Syntrophomonadaceae bacterium]